jgi:hypothetical protein
MAVADEPLHYIRRFIVSKEELELYRKGHALDLDLS